MEAFAAIALPALMGLLAVGAVLFIKVRRRRNPQAPGVATAVPARPLAPGQARRLLHGYLVGAAVVLGLLVLLAFELLT